MGGSTNENKVLSSVDEWDPAMDSWSMTPAVPNLPHARKDATAFVWQGDIWLVGGSDSQVCVCVCVCVNIRTHIHASFIHTHIHTHIDVVCYTQTHTHTHTPGLAGHDFSLLPWARSMEMRAGHHGPALNPRLCRVAIIKMC